MSVTVKAKAGLVGSRELGPTLPCKSHDELDNITQLDRGDVDDWAKRLKKMKESYGLRIIGCCFGTDHEHIAALATCRSTT